MLNVVSLGGKLFAVIPQQQLVTDFQNYQSYDMDGNEYTGAWEGPPACLPPTALLAEQCLCRRASHGEPRSIRVPVARCERRLTRMGIGYSSSKRGWAACYRW